jgi:hypothetical protein
MPFSLLHLIVSRRASGEFFRRVSSIAQERMSSPHLPGVIARVIFFSGGLQYTQATSLVYRSGAGMDIQFVKNVFQVSFDSIEGNHQRTSDLWRGKAACKQLKNPPFLLAQRLVQREG